MVFTPNDIENGKDAVREIPINKINDTMFLAPLTDGQYKKITVKMTQGGMKTLKGKLETEKAKRKKGGDSKIDYEVDPSKAAESAYKGDVMAICYSLNNEEYDKLGFKWTEDMIEGLPAGSVEEIALKVYEISGVDDPNKSRSEMDNFREEE